MKPTESKNLSEVNRLSGKHQVDEKRIQILDAAEKLFLEKGIVNTCLAEIARAVGITKAALHRYFANKDAIAIQIQIRMLNRIFVACACRSCLPKPMSTSTACSLPTSSQIGSSPLSFRK